MICHDEAQLINQRHVQRRSMQQCIDRTCLMRAISAPLIANEGRVNYVLRPEARIGVIYAPDDRKILSEV